MRTENKQALFICKKLRKDSYLHYMKTFIAFFETTKNTKQVEGGRGTVYATAC